MALLLTLCLTVAAVAMIVAMRYLLVSGAFAWLTARRHPRLQSGRQSQIGQEIRWSLISALIYAVPAGFALWAWREKGWSRLYSNLGDYPLWWLVASLPLYLVLHDTWFYWSHRWLHRPAPFRFAHAVHHSSRPPTAWAAMSFHPIEAVTGAVIIPLLLFLIPIHYSVLMLLLVFMTLMGTTNHMGWELFPRRLVHGHIGKWLITASHHERHHRQYRCNYGLYFRFWDRLCGTDAGLGDFAK